MVISAEKVADIIAEKIEEQKDHIKGNTDERASTIEVDVDIRRKQLLEISQRTHLRGVFAQEVVKHLVNKGLDAQFSDGVLSVRDYEHSDPDVYTIETI